ncbi:MAG: hypothetical protein HYY96_14810 [Candidatus Tectomicrobia bacterium]|nr:hypothetical protein [Candidatus Tectomicrobia bacterium]
MRLELHHHQVSGISFGEATGLGAGMLTINREELSALLLADERLAAVSFDLAAPGEDCRIIQVWDVVEARYRGDGANFPGILGPIEAVGRGVTHTLKGMGVVITNPSSRGPEAKVIDMAGLGAEWGLYGRLHHLVVQPQPAPGLPAPELLYALRKAQVAAAVYLARAAAAARADEVEVFDLPPLGSRPDADSGLPRVAYVFQIHSHQRPTEDAEPVLYGNNVRNFLPTILHPNEVLDGALVRSYYRKGFETYTVQNHPIIREMYARHGKELEFAGVVATVAHQTEPERLQSAAMAANLVAEVLGANGAVLTKTGGGAPHIDMAQIAELLEARGVATVMMAMDMSVDGSAEGGSLFSFPGADAIVNYGFSPSPLALPPAARIIGGAPETLVYGRPASGAIEVDLEVLAGAENPIGANRVMAAHY